MNSEDSYQTINYRISEWAGVDGTEYFGRYGRSFDKDGYPPDFYHSNAAMDLLGVLVERGYKPELSYHNLNWWHKFSLPGYKQPEYYAIKTTIPAAICHAILELIEREGR